MREIHIRDESSRRKKGESSKNVEVIEETEAENTFDVNPLEAKKIESENVEGAKDYVKVKFEKFVELMANHDFKSVLQKHADEDMILKTNLLTDLANAHTDEGKNKNWPVIFAIGIVLGIIAAYILFKFF